MKRPGRIVLAGVAACCVIAALGGAGAFVSYLSTRSFLASRYGKEGRGTLQNDCQRVTSSGLPDRCFEGPVGILLGDSHASVLFGSFAKGFDMLGIRLVSIAGPGCYPSLFAPRPRRENRDHRCANRIGPFERLLARRTPVKFVIISANWRYTEEAASLLSELISEFDSARTRILLIGPVPIFSRSSLECVVFSDRFGDDRDRCAKPRRDVETESSMIAEVLKNLSARFANVRFVDPLDVFCDATICRPFNKDAVFFSDTHHVLPRGADEIYDSFESDFLWLAGRE